MDEALADGVAAKGVDSHHHLWVPDPYRFPWLAKPGLDALNRPFSLADLAAAVAGTDIGTTVVVQAADDTTETGELLALADDPTESGATFRHGTLPGHSSRPRIAGVVGWLDIDDPAAPARLARLLGGPGGQRLAGIRANLRGMRDPNWLTGPIPARALRRLAAEGLSLDVLAGPPALPAVAAVAAANPELRVILDHAGHPPLGAPHGQFAAWGTSIRTLARVPNVAVKFSGLVTRAAGMRWNADDLRPVADILLTAFGEDRLLFGSDWPICLLSAPYAEVAAAAREALSGADPVRIFGANARSWYRLRSPTADRTKGRECAGLSRAAGGSGSQEAGRQPARDCPR